MRFRIVAIQVLTCGAGSYGRLGNFDTTDQLYLEPVEVLTVEHNIVQIASGKAYTLALTKDGILYGWGRNHQGQLGVGLGLAVDMYAMQNIPEPIETDELVNRRVTKVSAGPSHAACITSGGELFYWGMGLHLEPVRVNALMHTQVVDVVCGKEYTIAKDVDGHLYSFGKGKNGCLGQGGNVKQLHQATRMESFGDDHTIVQLSAGWNHAACLVRTPVRPEDE
jgi:alpha-tubulin suppressor-like RCC1 family protein